MIGPPGRRAPPVGGAATTDRVHSRLAAVTVSSASSCDFSALLRRLAVTVTVATLAPLAMAALLAVKALALASDTLAR